MELKIGNLGLVVLDSGEVLMLSVVNTGNERIIYTLYIYLSIIWTSYYTL